MLRLRFPFAAFVCFTFVFAFWFVFFLTPRLISEEDLLVSHPKQFRPPSAPSSRHHQHFVFQHTNDEQHIQSVSGGSSPVPFFSPHSSSSPAPSSLDQGHTQQNLWHTITPAQREALSGILEYSYQDILKATNNFSEKNILGEGAAGVVYKGVLKDRTKVAVKRIPDEYFDGIRVDGFLEEVKILSVYRHPNIISLLGYARSPPIMHQGKLQNVNFLVFEQMKNGDLGGLINDSAIGKKPFLWQDRLATLIDAARGLSHLINANPRVIHRDIKPGNILVDDKMRAKVADLGIALMTRANSVQPWSEAGTPGYADPLYLQTGVASEFTDVYSFGMVMLEALTGYAPAFANRFGEITERWPEDMTPEQVVKYLDRTANWPTNIARIVAAEALACIDRLDGGRSARPTFVDILEALENLQEVTQKF